jgi:hypothetical protein
MKKISIVVISCAIVLLAACGGSLDDSEPSSSNLSSGSGSSSGSTTLASCSTVTYPGDKSDPQVYSYDAIAQFDSCAYKATNDARYKTDGDNQCKVLAGLLAATKGTFRPLYCSGSSMKLS